MFDALDEADATETRRPFLEYINTSKNRRKSDCLRQADHTVKIYVKPSKNVFRSTSRLMKMTAGSSFDLRSISQVPPIY